MMGFCPGDCCISIGCLAADKGVLAVTAVRVDGDTSMVGDLMVCAVETMT